MVLMNSGLGVKTPVVESSEMRVPHLIITAVFPLDEWSCLTGNLSAHHDDRLMPPAMQKKQIPDSNVPAPLNAVVSCQS